MSIHPVFVTASFRDEILKSLPGLDLAPSVYWPILGLVAFPWWRDEAKGQIIVGNSVLAQALGRESENKRRKFSGSSVLRDFSRDVFPIEWTEGNWDTVGGPMRMRRLTAVAVPSDAKALVERERRTRGEAYVNLNDGAPFTPARQRDLRAQSLAEAAALAAERGCASTRRVASYMNALPPHRFSKLARRVPEAHDLVDRLGRDVDRQHDLLRAVETQALPIYGPAPRTARIFPVNDSFLACKREVRELLTSGWHHADLRSCQLAIAARLWDVGEVEQYLRSGKDVWAELIAWMGLPAGQDSKGIVKRTLYGVVYGQGRDGRARDLDAALGDGVARRRRFDKHPLVAAMLSRRTHMMGQVLRAGGATDCFGRHLAVEDSTVDPRRPRTNVPSILAMLAQAEETALLLPVLALAEAELEKPKPGFMITMWLHDGFSIDVSDERAAGRWKDRLKAAVDKEVVRKGFATELTW